MKETIRIVVPGDTRDKMVKTAREGIDRALSKLEPPFGAKNDQIKLYSYANRSNRITLIYKIWRDVQSFAGESEEEDVSEEDWTSH